MTAPNRCWGRCVVAPWHWRRWAAAGYGTPAPASCRPGGAGVAGRGAARQAGSSQDKQSP
ncbi:MAG: hypothetical protein IPH15_14600 [Comamonadaceae bacterium]|nr:hypothetical protein [Comamonadaceae bacterium]